MSCSPQNLDVTVALYNQVRENILDVEYPLVESQLARIDQQLVQAISQLNWTSDGEARNTADLEGGEEGVGERGE